MTDRTRLQFGLGTLFWLTLTAAIMARNLNLVGPVAIVLTVLVAAHYFFLQEL